MASANVIYMGPAGWSYPDWKNIVYPALEKDPLSFLVNYVNCIEINSTYYNPPKPQVTEGWVNKVKDIHPKFRFTYKLWGKITHAQEYSKENIAIFKASTQPLLQQGHDVLLVQFPFYFEASQENISFLHQLAEDFSEYTLVLEVRHNSFDKPDLLEQLGKLGYSICWPDYPQAKNSFVNHSTVLNNLIYLRLHGRNTENWFSKTATVSSKYDYRYSKEELNGLIKKIRKELVNKRSVYVIANNHYQGKGLSNVLQMKYAFEKKPISVPRHLLETYPDLAYISEQPEQLELF